MASTGPQTYITTKQSSKIPPQRSISGIQRQAAEDRELISKHTRHFWARLRAKQIEAQQAIMKEVQGGSEQEQPDKEDEAGSPEQNGQEEEDPSRSAPAEWHPPPRNAKKPKAHRRR